MATATWTDGGADGDWTNADNWSGGSGGGGIPATGNSVVIATSSRDITTNIVQTYNLVDLTIGPKFTGTIGTQALPLSLGLITGTFDYGQKIGTTSIFFTLCSVVNVQSTSTENPALIITDKADGTNASILDINILGGKGTVLLDQVTATRTLTMTNAKSVTVEIGTGSDVSGLDVVMDEGRLVSYMELEDVIMTGGLLEYIPATGTCPSVTMYDGTFKWKATGANTITALIAYGGFFDSRAATASAMTMTDATLYEGAVLDERNGLNNTTYSNALVMRGGILKLNPKRTLDIDP